MLSNNEYFLTRSSHISTNFSLFFLYNKDIFLNVFWLFSLKYLGQWYEIEWLSDRYEDPDTLYEDYTQLYSRRQDGNITITTRGR